MSADSTYCPACDYGDHGRCDPLRLDAPGRLCECWACLPNDYEEADVTEPDGDQKDPGVPADQFPDGDDIDSTTVEDDGAPTDDL